jgi:putative oxidoreductase
MKPRELHSAADYASLVLRIFLAAVLWPHGAQKLLGWFDGLGFSNSMSYFTGTVGLPWFLGLIVIIIEFFGPIAVLAGWATRVWSLLIAVVMTGVIVSVMHEHFFMNWFGTNKTEGAEFFLLAIGIATSLVVLGSGRISLEEIKNQKVKKVSREE